MALRLYLTESEADLIEEGNEDEVREAVESGATLTDETVIYIKSDNTDLTYENITIAMEETETNGVVVEYALDDGVGDPVTYADPLTVPDGAYTSFTPIHRRAVAANVTEAFKRTDIKHKVTADEYIAD